MRKQARRQKAPKHESSAVVPRVSGGQSPFPGADISVETRNSRGGFRGRNSQDLGPRPKFRGCGGWGLPGLEEGRRRPPSTPCLLGEHFPGEGAGEKLCPRPWGWPGITPTWPCLLPSLSFPLGSPRRDPSSQPMWVVPQALPSSFCENETKGLLIKPRARHLKCHMGLREAWVGRGGAPGRLQLPSPPVEGRKEPWLLGSQGRFWSWACGLGSVTAPAFRRCTMTTIRATFAHTHPQPPAPLCWWSGRRWCAGLTLALAGSLLRTTPCAAPPRTSRPLDCPCKETKAWQGLGRGSRSFLPFFFDPQGL